jgi:hypothetical protein
MGTISGFLGRKGTAPASTALPASAPPAQQAPSSTGENNEPTFADLGARIGEGNETLRNMLIDTDRRITALDDVKSAFRNLVEPIGIALRALEQEKTDNVGLRNALAEVRTRHDTARGECQTLEKRAAESESDNQCFQAPLAATRCNRPQLESPHNTDLTWGYLVLRVATRRTRAHAAVPSGYANQPGKRHAHCSYRPVRGRRQGRGSSGVL